MSDTEAWLDVNVGPKHVEEQVAVVEVRIVPGSRMTVDKVIDYTYAELGPWGPDVTMRVIDHPAASRGGAGPGGAAGAHRRDHRGLDMRRNE